MIEIKNDTLEIRFPEIQEALRSGFDRELERLHEELSHVRLPFEQADQSMSKWPSEPEIQSMRESLTDTRIQIRFQRTLRIPDDGKEYPLPAGLGPFPIEHLEDHAARISKKSQQRGGVLIPMYQREALWLEFSGSYPMALKVATGKICCVTGKPWSDNLSNKPQNYLALPEQPWLDGYVVAKGVIRQFVATPAGEGATVEEQLSGKAEWNGMQLQAFPMKAEVYIKDHLIPKLQGSIRTYHRVPRVFYTGRFSAKANEMGLGAGGRMKQEISLDRYCPEVYSSELTSRCFVHFLNALQWQAVTGGEPPESPVSWELYNRTRMPWFHHYSEQPGVDASSELAGIRSVEEIQDKYTLKKGNLDGNW